MARRGNVRVSITGETSGLGRATKDAEGKLSRLNRAGSASLRGLGNAAKYGGAALVASLVVGIKKSADAAIEAEKAQARLNAQLDAIGKNSPKVRSEIDKIIQSQSQMSGFDDEDLQDSFVNIVRVTGDVTQALERNQLAMDISRARGLDLAKASDVVAKVSAGNVGILKRYGVEIEKDATAQEALAAAQQKFAGQAEAYGRTTAGSVDRANVAFENLAEVGGGLLAPTIQRLADGLATFAMQVQNGTGVGGQFRDTVENIATTVGRLSTSVGPLALDILQFASGIVSSRAGVVLLTAAAGALLGRMVALGAAFAIGKIAAFVSALQAARAGVIALTTATAATGLGALLVVVGAVAGALVGFSNSSEKAATSSRDVTDAVNQQREALKRLNDLDLEATQRKLDLRNANIQVQRAEERLKTVRKDASATALDVKEAENQLEQARLDQERAQRGVNRVEGDAKEVRRQAVHSIEDEITTRRDHIRSLLDEAAKLALQGGRTDEVAAKVRQAVAEQRKLNDAINQLRSKKIIIEIERRLTGSKLPGNIGRAFEALGKVQAGATTGGGPVLPRRVAAENTPQGTTGLPGGLGFEGETAAFQIRSAQAAGTATLEDDEKVIRDRIKSIRGRIKSINAALPRVAKAMRTKSKGGKNRKQRQAAAEKAKQARAAARDAYIRLLGEKASLIDEINSLNEALAEINKPPEPVDTAPPPTAGDTGDTSTPSAPEPPPDTAVTAPESTGVTADAQAQIDQANARAAVEAERARLAEAAVRAFGSSGDIGAGGSNAIRAAGGVTINVNTLHPGDPSTLAAIGRAATAGLAFQGSVLSPRTSFGI